jgi:FtsP/CotA-like multicopper oxidase with cupredoxin domain
MRLRLRLPSHRPATPRGLVLGAAAAVALALGQLATPAALGSGRSACRTMTMYAEELPPSSHGDVRLGYGLTADSASIPGPTVEMFEGECLTITLVNDVSTATLSRLRDLYGGGSELPLAVSIHPHGVRYHRQSDGTVSSRSWVGSGESRKFTWIAAPHTAGYWWYHDHVVGTEHGTGGMASGLFGGLIVRKATDPRPEVPAFVVAMGDNFTINLQTYPDTPGFRAAVGQRIEFLVFAWGNETHSFHLHGHSWADNRTGLWDGASADTPAIDNRTLAPGSSFGFQVIAGETSGPNNWMYHCHVQFHSDFGMMGFLQVEPAS